MTPSQLRRIAPNLTEDLSEELVGPINRAMEKWSIDTPMRQAAFLAQIAHETGGFRWLHELGDGTYFKKYEGQKSLGNVRSGDGARFKGRGFIHITGRANYTEASEELGIDLVENPELAESPEVAADVAGWFWDKRNLNQYADDGEFETITKRINGGLNGYKDRLRYYRKAKEVLA